MMNLGAVRRIVFDDGEVAENIISIDEITLYGAGVRCGTSLDIGWVGADGRYRRRKEDVNSMRIYMEHGSGG